MEKMAGDDHWMDQGRQYHGWFGHGTLPLADDQESDTKSGRLFDPGSVGQRIDEVARVATGPAALRYARPVASQSLARFRTAVAVWYAASSLSDEDFARLLGRYTPTKFIGRCVALPVA
jgi:hypothetical protein